MNGAVISWNARPRFSRPAWKSPQSAIASTLFCVIATAAGAPTPTASHFTSLSGSSPAEATSARATGTAPDVRAETPMVLPRRSAAVWIGLPRGTTTRKMVTREIA